MHCFLVWQPEHVYIKHATEVWLLNHFQCFNLHTLKRVENKGLSKINTSYIILILSSHFLQNSSGPWTRHPGEYLPEKWKGSWIYLFYDMMDTVPSTMLLAFNDPLKKDIVSNMEQTF